jgi:hypothetical protein
MGNCSSTGNRPEDTDNGPVERLGDAEEKSNKARNKDTLEAVTGDAGEGVMGDKIVMGKVAQQVPKGDDGKPMEGPPAPPPLPPAAEDQAKKAPPAVVGEEKVAENVQAAAEGAPGEGTPGEEDSPPAVAAVGAEVKAGGGKRKTKKNKKKKGDKRRTKRGKKERRLRRKRRSRKKKGRGSKKTKRN